jgi:phosphate acetyltransferase
MAVQRVVFTEGEDQRILEAASILSQKQGLDITIVGDATKISDCAQQHQIGIDRCRLIDLANDHRKPHYAARLQTIRDLNKLSIAERFITKPLFFAAMMVAEHDADLVVAGATCATKKVIEAAALCIGYDNDQGFASSFFILETPNRAEPLIVADCAVNIDPTAQQLAVIASDTARSAATFVAEPRVAMLSFSTQGSATHPAVSKVQEATALAKQLNPALRIDGEMQVDTALSERVAAQKWIGESAVAGRANVLIFPDLNSGNIGYKLIQQMTQARAIGPILQGFRRPVADLSRGASIEEIIEVTQVALRLQQ